MPERTIKILIVGPSNVGKSALLKRYCDDDFDADDASATVGIDYRVKRLSVRGTTYRVTLLDTAGQERFRTLSTSYYRGAHGIVFVYDLTNRATFAQMDTYFAEAELHAELYAGSASASSASASASSAPPCQVCVVGAKLDRAASSRAVTADEGLALATRFCNGDSNGDSNGAPLFFETSARTGDNVRAPFVALVDRIVSSGGLASASARRPAGTVSLRPTDSDGDGGYLSGCAC